MASATVAATTDLFSPTPDIPTIIRKDLKQGVVQVEYVHESGNGIRRDLIEIFEQSFEETYFDPFKETVVAASFVDCPERIEDAVLECKILCEEPEWCCRPLEEDVMECPFQCQFLKGGKSIFDIGGALAYDITDGIN